MRNISSDVESKVGKLPLASRYHELPKRVQDDYEVDFSSVLGSGYSGDVHLARAKDGGGTQTFAVKHLPIKGVSQARWGQLESEVKIFLCMDHPNVTRLVDVYRDDDDLHLVMEHMKGGELFDRVTELKKFSEMEAAGAVSQILLALSYIHGFGIAHRDLKLENFLYDQEKSDHLKLIDFGFSHMWDTNTKMRATCGTLAYVAPEVLRKSYTSQCDMWSVGVIAFILLAGSMPFYGSEATQMENIMNGRYKFKPEKWNSVSKAARDFVQKLLQVNPEARLTARKALEHVWIVRRYQLAKKEIDPSVVDALRQFSKSSKFRRSCLKMMAWSLSNEERAKVRGYFTALDTQKTGTITLEELRECLVEKFNISDSETQLIFQSMDANRNEHIQYSDFLAAMVSTRLQVHDDLLRTAFRKFDVDRSGVITVDNLSAVVESDGDEKSRDEDLRELLKEGDLLHDGQISYAEFVSFISGVPISCVTLLESGSEVGTGSSTVYPKIERSKGLNCWSCFRYCFVSVCRRFGRAHV